MNIMALAQWDAAAAWDAALIDRALQDAAIQACLAAGAPDLATAERWLDDAEINIGE